MHCTYPIFDRAVGPSRPSGSPAVIEIERALVLPPFERSNRHGPWRTLHLCPSHVETVAGQESDRRAITR